jgi:superfamily II RNA helicase
MQYRGLTLDAFQAEAIAHLQAEKSVLVAAPTGTGKTIIADWIVEEAMRTGKRVIYTAPIKALSNQKYRDYCRLHGEERVGLVTGDLVIRRNAPCLVMTTEILRNMLLAGEPLTDLLAVVVDEVHFLDDRERGTVWEEVLIYLPQHVLIVALSATLPNLDEFSAWLSEVRQRKVEVVIEQRRAVPLDFWFATRAKGLLRGDEFEELARTAQAAPAYDRRGRHGPGRGRGRGRDGEGRDEVPRTHPIDALKMVRQRDWLPMLYFVFSRKDAERFAIAASSRYRAELLTPAEADRVRERLDALQPIVGNALDRELREMYLRGIAFHHAGLHVHLKALVEELYEERLIKCLFCTSTFALGINMPARTVVFHGLEKYDGQEVRPLPTRGFMQKAGRAGRRGLDEAGHVVIRMDPDEYAALKQVILRYRKQVYEPVRSSFSLSFNSIVNLLGRHGVEAIRTIVGKSFLNWQRKLDAERQLGRAAALERGLDGDPPTKSDLKEARRARQRAADAEDACWREFLTKRNFLQRIGYLDAEDGFNAGARVLQHVQIAEILVTELVMAGTFEPLDNATLFGVLCGLCGDLPRGVSVEIAVPRKQRELLQEIGLLRMSKHVTEAEGITQQAAIWSPELAILGKMWADGEKLETVLGAVRSPTDIAGTLVGHFRRAKDLAGQLVDVYADVPEKKRQLLDIVRAVSRDEVEVVD